MRVIHLPTTVGGNPQGISHHLNRLGIKSETWAFDQNYLGYPADKVICNGKEWKLIRGLKRIFALRYVFSADIVFFNCGGGFFHPFNGMDPEQHLGYKKYLIRFYAFYLYVMSKIEVGLLGILRKPILIQYQGSDARQGDFCKTNFSITFADRVDPHFFSPKGDEARRNSIQFYAKNTVRIYALNPDLLHILPKNAEFLPYSHISLNEWLPSFTQLEDRPLRIAHAPSNRAIKGTDLIVKAVSELLSDGHQFEFILVEGVSNSKAKDIYKTVDVFIDQLFAGWYGGLAVEAMALGKPVVAYIRQDDMHFIPAQMHADLPIIQALPNTIRDVIESILTMPRTDLLDKARKSRAYVEKWHDPMLIAQRIKDDMQAALCRMI